ncbi:MAG: SCO family protein [Acidobacteriaceae bacterium]|nr:SCO family protein [Acidobacteriaceae bacterium]
MHCFHLFAAALLIAPAAEFGLAQAPAAGSDTHPEDRAKLVYHGGLVSPPLPKPQFTLTDTSGIPFDFRSKTDGYVTLLFFGYTNCADVCPMHMSYLGSALKRLPKNVAGRFKVVFVTTDPDRDNPRTLRAWLNNFDSDFIGLSGTVAEIRAAQSAAGVPAAKGPPSYDHAAFIVAYSADNLGHLIYPSGISEADWLQDLPQLAKETWSR